MTLTQDVRTERTTARRGLVLLGIALGYFMVLLDTSVLAVAEPDLAHSLRTSVAGLQWAVTGYTVAFGALLLSAGAVADRFGARRVFTASIAVFGIASLLSAGAPNLATLVVLRALLGVAAAGSVPASMAMITALYGVPEARARAISLWAGISGSAVAAGPIIGGILISLGGWRWVFLVNVPLAIAVLALVGRRTSMEKGAGSNGKRIDWAAQLAGCAALALLTDTLIAAGAKSWIHAGVSGAVAVAAAVVFVSLERRSASPVVNRALIASGSVRAGLVAGAAVNFALTGMLFVLPLLLQDARHLSPVQTGLAFLPLTVPFAVNPPFTGRMVARVGARPPILLGLSLIFGGGVLLGVVVLAGGAYPLMAAGLLLTGFGVSFALPALVTAIVNVAPEGTAGSVGGLLNAVRQSGATLGVALMGALAEQAPGWSLLIAAVACALALAAFAPQRKAVR